MGGSTVKVAGRKPVPRMSFARLTNGGDAVLVTFDRPSSLTLGAVGGRSAPCDLVFANAQALLGVGSLCRWTAPMELLVSLGCVACVCPFRGDDPGSSRGFWWTHTVSRNIRCDSCWGSFLWGDVLHML